MWTKIKALIPMTVLLATIQGACTWFSSHWIDGQMKARFDVALENYKFELKAREQAAAIAEYAALAINLKATDDAQTYRRANQLAWELFLWLPDDVYRKLGRGLSDPSEKGEMASALTDVRKLLLSDRAGTLGPDDLIVHGPNIRPQMPSQK
jgi:hypothetical protein